MQIGETGLVGVVGLLGEGNGSGETSGGKSRRDKLSEPVYTKGQEQRGKGVGALTEIVRGRNVRRETLLWLAGGRKRESQKDVRQVGLRFSQVLQTSVNRISRVHKEHGGVVRDSCWGENRRGGTETRRNTVQPRGQGGAFRQRRKETGFQ